MEYKERYRRYKDHYVKNAMKYRYRKMSLEQLHKLIEKHQRLIAMISEIIAEKEVAVEGGGSEQKTAVQSEL